MYNIKIHKKKKYQEKVESIFLIFLYKKRLLCCVCPSTIIRSCDQTRLAHSFFGYLKVCLNHIFD